MTGSALFFFQVMPNMSFLLVSSFVGGHFFHRNSLSPRSLVYENDFSSIEPVLDMYDENKTWRGSAFYLLCSLSLFLLRFSFLLLYTPSMGVLCLKKSGLFQNMCLAARLQRWSSAEAILEDEGMKIVHHKSAVGGCRVKVVISSASVRVSVC